MRTISIEVEIKNLIELRSEGEYWDFKQVWHKDNERLLHDILCFANTVHDRECYLIIGVSDIGEIVGVSGENRRRQVDILDLLSNTVFAGDNIPEIRLDTIEIEGKEIDVLTIFNSYTVPYYLKTKCKKHNNIREGYIYTRVGDRNTPINKNTTIQQIEMLWKKRFGLTQPPLVQIVKRLGNKLEWIQNEGTYYNIYKPEFKLETEYDEDDRNKGEFYVYSQTNSRFMYKSLKIVCSGTILKEFQLVVLDSGRYETPVPKWGFVGHDEWKYRHKYTYKYFLKDSIEYKIQQFLFDRENGEEVYAKTRFDEVVLYYENEEEKSAFEFYVENKQSLIESYLIEANDRFYEIDSNNEMEVKECKHRLSTGIALNRALQEFRTLYK